MTSLIEAIEAEAPRLTALRRDLHAHPELCFKEVRTSELIARQLGEWGIEVHRGLGTTGVVGVIQGGTGTRAVALRADIDRAAAILDINAAGLGVLREGDKGQCQCD